MRKYGLRNDENIRNYNYIFNIICFDIIENSTFHSAHALEHNVLVKYAATLHPVRYAD